MCTVMPANWYIGHVRALQEIRDWQCLCAPTCVEAGETILSGLKLGGCYAKLPLWGAPVEIGSNCKDHNLHKYTVLTDRCDCISR